MSEAQYTVQVFSDGNLEIFELYQIQSSKEDILVYRTEGLLGSSFVRYCEINLDRIMRKLDNIALEELNILIDEITQFGGMFFPLLAELLVSRNNMAVGKPSGLSKARRQLDFLRMKTEYLSVMLRFFFVDNSAEDLMVEYLKMRVTSDSEMYAPVHFKLTEMNLITTSDGTEIPAMVLRTTDSEECYNFLLYHMLKYNRQYRTCKHCNRLFPVRPQSKVEYCDRLIGEGDKRCIDVGASRRYEKKTADIPAMREYQRSYKAHNARIRYGRMTREEFTAWAKEARAKRELCQAGELSLEDFVAWLDSDKMK